jgi:uncharacterized membrane protein
MLVATLVISGREWLWPLAGFLAVALLAMAWAYRRAAAGGTIRGVCIFLKGLGLLTLAACLLEPLWSGERARPGSNLFLVLADNSEGMQIKDHGETRSRGELLHAMLTADKADWRAKLDENFQVRRYLFDARLQSTKDYSELAFDGRATALGAALRTVADRYRGQPVAGVLILTDGNATDLPEGKLEVAGLPPLYPVVIGRDDAIKDLALQKVTVSQTAFEDAPVTVQAEVLASGYEGRSIAAQVLDRHGKSAAEQTQRAPRDGESIPFRLQLRPEKGGISFYRLRVSAKGELDQFDKPQTSTEATLANNSRVLVVDRGRGPYRILYVAGRPNWEYKFLNRAVTEDEQVQLVGLIRIAKREPKFEFIGRPGESSNPLFRGFGNQSKEEVERYDQPVLVRLYPDKDSELRFEATLRGGFPRIPEDLYEYHAVIVDDLEAEFFTRDQMALLQKFVSERGGGFLMLGGAESFHEGKYERTPVGDMLPVYLDHVAEQKPTTNFQLSLTREGWLQPWARLRNNEGEEKARLEAMPGFQVLNRVRDIKPGASVIAMVQDESGHKFPALAVQRFGNGRVAAMMIGDVWRWGLHDEASHRDMDKAWRQLTRWLVADVPNRVELTVEPKRDDPNQAVLLKARVRDKKFQPLDNATVNLTVQVVTNIFSQTQSNVNGQIHNATNSVRIMVEPALNERGLYQATYVPRETAGYRAEATATDETGVEAGRAETGWTADPAAEEFRSLKPNRALLETIARQTGGEVIPLTRLDSFAAGLPNRKAPITENWTVPLWHRSAVFLFAFVCFIAEWGLRRWKGMA